MCFTKLALICVPTIVLAQDVAPARGRIELGIGNPVGALGREWPLYCGVPLPKGSLASVRDARVVDSTGKPVPAQMRRLATWIGTEDLRWLGVDFLGDPSGRY